MNDKSYEYLYKKVNYCIKCMFFTPLLRLCASINIDPKLVKYVTCFIDGHNSGIRNKLCEYRYLKKSII